MNGWVSRCGGLHSRFLFLFLIPTFFFFPFLFLGSPPSSRLSLNPVSCSFRFASSASCFPLLRLRHGPWYWAPVADLFGIRVGPSNKIGQGYAFSSCTPARLWRCRTLSKNWRTRDPNRRWNKKAKGRWAAVRSVVRDQKATQRQSSYAPTTTRPALRLPPHSGQNENSRLTSNT